MPKISQCVMQISGTGNCERLDCTWLLAVCFAQYFLRWLRMIGLCLSFCLGGEIVNKKLIFLPVDLVLKLSHDGVVKWMENRYFEKLFFPCSSPAGFFAEDRRNLILRGCRKVRDLFLRFFVIAIFFRSTDTDQVDLELVFRPSR